MRAARMLSRLPPGERPGRMGPGSRGADEGATGPVSDSPSTPGELLPEGSWQVGPVAQVPPPGAGVSSPLEAVPGDWDGSGGERFECSCCTNALLLEGGVSFPSSPVPRGDASGGVGSAQLPPGKKGSGGRTKNGSSPGFHSRGSMPVAAVRSRGEWMLISVPFSARSRTGGRQRSG